MSLLYTLSNDVLAWTGLADIAVSPRIKFFARVRSCHLMRSLSMAVSRTKSKVTPKTAAAKSKSTKSTSRSLESSDSTALSNETVSRQSFVAKQDDVSVEQRAYEIWVEEGCPEGRALEHWLRAEQEISSPPPIRRSRARSVERRA